MILALRVSVLLFTLLCSKSEIHLSNTNDGLGIDHYDCVRLESLDYCRRPRESIDLLRDNHNRSCQENGGQLHRFSELRSRNMTFSTLLHQWKLTLQDVERYSLFLKDPREQDGSLCQCLHKGSFGKKCEYQLPVGETFEETLQWQLNMRKVNPQEVQIHGDVVCHATLQCDSGTLCLDWREICDGIQQCMSGWDEENCDLLEMNRCNENEYRCSNGLCIPQEFFLDGDFDCLDWSDEMPFKRSDECPLESVNTGCDDHLCPSNSWSCGDGQCIRDRLAFQKGALDSTCVSKRDQYFMCETHKRISQWTMPNGRCFQNSHYEESRTANLTAEDQCQHLLKCLLSWGLEKNCLCRNASGCVEELDRVCPLSIIQYPRGAVGTPFTFFLYNRQRHWTNDQPDFILINGTVRCRDVFITVTRIIPFDINWNERQMIEELFCRPLLSTNTSSTGHACHHKNESTDVCGEWNHCLSMTRLRDGEKNCLNGRDEEDQREMELDKSCAGVRRHRFRCSKEEPSCLSVMKLGDRVQSCRNERDELWFGMGRPLSSIGCNDQRQDQCSLLRQYISQSSLTSINPSEKFRLPFRSHCDTFLDLPRGEDEDLRECRQRWICPKDQQRCQTGQCIEQRWINDYEWDCADASDEHQSLNDITQLTLRRASEYDFTNRSFFVPSTCNQSHPFLCLSAQATRQGFSCFNLSQIGDGHVDCAGAFDERNTLEHCSESSSMLGSHFRCASTSTCIPFHLHCSDEHRCPRRSDDQFWCERQWRPSNCSGRNDFVCFDGRCVKEGRCNRYFECPFGEDEYMCDYLSSLHQSLVPYRQAKRFWRGTSPSNANVEQRASNSSSSLSPYRCNRGLGVLLMNGSIVCFCPPQYYGEKCEYHQDRLSVVLQLNLSQSIDVNETGLQLLLVLFMFEDRVLMSEQFHLHPTERKKLISHFQYPHSSEFLRQRRQRFFNRTDLLTRHPFSIRIELYRTRINEQPTITGVWRYPVEFDHLPVSRLAKVLHVDRSSQRNPCSSRPCHPNGQCHQLMSNRLDYICLCPTNFTGKNCSQEDQQCRQGYCSTGSLCQPDSRSVLRGNSSPFCLCPLDRSGQRCAIEHSACRSNPCLNGGSCLPDVQPDRVICLCPQEGYFGSRCQWRRSSIDLFLSTNLSSDGVVIQFFDIDRLSLDLLLVDQHVFRTFPHQIESSRPDRSIISGIVLVKFYSSNRSSLPDLHLVSARENVFVLNRTAEISSMNRCPHLQTFSNDSSPIRYHQICIADSTRLCFRDQIYLCVCAENHTQADCFLYDDELDRCSNCLGNARCLKGNPRRSNDFLCLDSSAHSTQQFTSTTKYSAQLINSTKNSSPSVLAESSLLIVSLLVFSLLTDN